MRADIHPGARFPDYELPDHTNIPRRLSALQGDNPMILTLARGHYCPKEMQQHLDLAALWPKIRVAYTEIVTITTEDMLALNEFRTAIGACWTFLSDRERVLQRDLQIVEYTEIHYDQPLIPHTLVLERTSASTKSTMATGSGDALRRTICGMICGKSRAVVGPTGTSRFPACGRPGSQGIDPDSSVRRNRRSPSLRIGSDTTREQEMAQSGHASRPGHAGPLMWWSLSSVES
jgi:peroxiredoxin